MSGFLLPEPAKERPPYVPLAIEWPYELIATISDRRRLVYRDEACSMLESELRLTSHTTGEPLAFEVVTPAWNLGFEYVFRDDEPPIIRPTGDDGRVETTKGTTSLSALLSQHAPLVSFEHEIVLVSAGFLLRPERERLLYPVEEVETIDWSGINIQKESQGPTRESDSIQYRTIEVLADESDWEVVIDDDGTGELADIVLMRRRDQELDILLAHCKYSSRPEPGARIEDFYDVCGQAMKMNRAKSVAELLAGRLWRRETERQRQGKTGMVVGSLEVLSSIVREARQRDSQVTVAIVQPGASQARIGEDIRALLGGTERFLRETHNMKLRVIGSP